jgi:hypothetical protein
MGPPVHRAGFFRRSVGARMVAQSVAGNQLRSKYASLINNFHAPEMRSGCNVENRTDNSALTDVALG